MPDLDLSHWSCLFKSQSGYIRNSIVYIGTEMLLEESSNGLKSLRIVLTLAKDYLGQDYRQFLQNWYSLPSLYATFELIDAVVAFAVKMLNVMVKD
jgi:hypothetical protein